MVHSLDLFLAPIGSSPSPFGRRHLRRKRQAKWMSDNPA
jgi:hypothetical protein